MTPSKKPLWTLTAAAWSLAVLTLATSGSVPSAREAAAEAVLHLPAAVGSWSGEIVHADRYDLGQPIKLTCKVDAPVNATVARRWYGDGLKIRRLGDGSSVYVWGDAGEKSVRCIVAVYEPGETPQLEVRQYRAKFTIGPAPPPKPLSELVDADTAAKLAECLRTTVAGLKIASPASPAEFLATFTAYVGTKGLTDNNAWPVILARVEKAAPDGKPFDSAAVQGVLTATADELAKAPEPKPPGPTPNPTAKKLWLVAISRTPDRTSAQGALLSQRQLWPAEHNWVSLEDGPASAGYVKWASKLPCVVVMDAETKRVLGVEIIPGDVVEAWPASIAAKYTGGAK